MQLLGLINDSSQVSVFMLFRISQYRPAPFQSIKCIAQKQKQIKKCAGGGPNATQKVTITTNTVPAQLNIHQNNLLKCFVGDDNKIK
jgi:hypothetical protein